MTTIIQLELQIVRMKKIFQNIIREIISRFKCRVDKNEAGKYGYLSSGNSFLSNQA